MFCTFNLVLILICFVFVCIFFYVKYFYLYWQRRGIPYLEPSFPLGNISKDVCTSRSLHDQVDEFYKATSEPFIGIFCFHRPALLIRDPEMIQNILVKDFQHFVNRGVYEDAKRDPYSAQLFSIHDDDWKQLRQKTTRMFTTNKLKSMFTTIEECTHKLLDHLESVAESKETMDVRVVISRFTTNATLSIAFGLDVDCFADTKNLFQKHGQQVFSLNLKNAFRSFAVFLCPTLLKWSRIGLINPDSRQFYIDMVKKTMNLRKENNIVRDDIFQLLLQMHDPPSVKSEDGGNPEIHTKMEKKSFTIDQVAANAFMFHIAGFESTSSVMTFCLYEIAKNPQIQEKVCKELDRVLAQHNGQLTYESVSELKFLGCCIEETLRKYALAPLIVRECSRDYRLPGTKSIIEKGTSIVIPVYSLHHDEKFYPNPDKFDPTRFDENVTAKSTVDMPYFAFGDGPRNCIGIRMGRMSSRLGMASVLKRFHVKLGDQHIGTEIKFAAQSFLTTATDGVHLKFESKRSAVIQ